MGNELKLSLENFQSISKGELIFHTGTTVIIGQSNSGKSATFRALKACLLNPAGSQRFIKKGTKSSSVALEYNGNQIIWKRTPKESSYIINGEEYLKTGKSNAFKIIEDTGFAIDSNDTIMNIEEELQLPFPFGLSKSELFKLYEDVFCISDSAIILKAARTTEDEVRADIVTYENELNKNQNKLKELLDFKSSVDIEDLKSKRDRLSNKYSRILFLQEGLPVIKKAILVQDLSADEFSFENKYEVYKDKKNLKAEIIKLKKLHGVAKALKEVKDYKAVDMSYYKNCLDIAKTRHVLRRIEGFDAGIATFTDEIPKYKELIDLRRTLANLKKVKDIKVEVAEFESKLEEYKELKKFYCFINSLKGTIKKKKEDLKRVEEFVENIEQALKEYKVCPLCHQPINN